MSQPSVELSRASGVQLVRGAFLIALAGVAVRWPEATLLIAMVAAGAIAGSLGIFEVATATSSNAPLNSRVFYLGNGLVFVGFGALTASVPVASLQAATTLAMAWLLLYALYTLLLAARVWYLRPAREALLLWALVNVGWAVAAAFFPARTTLGLLYWGALYVALLGFVQVAAGAWIHRHIFSPARRAPVATRAGASTATERRTVI